MAVSEAVLSRQSAKLLATHLDIRPRTPICPLVSTRGRRPCVLLSTHASPAAACGLRERHDIVKPGSYVYSPASIVILAKRYGFREGLFK
jgi:hypothetical protein